MARLAGIFYGPVIRLQGRLKKDDGGLAAGHVGNFVNFFWGQGAAQERLFPIREPLFHDLVPADIVVSDLLGDVPPVGHLIQVDVKGGLPQVLQSLFRGEAQGRAPSRMPASSSWV